MKSLIACAVFLPVILQAQTIRVSGRVVDERQAPIQGAIVSATGSDSTTTTSASGTFALGVPIGLTVLSIAAPGYTFQTVRLELARDTTLTVVMRPRVVSLDTMVVRPRYARIKGTVLDSATSEPILFAQVRLYPAGRRVDVSNIGNFTFDTAATGVVTLVAEATEHLPASVTLDLYKDTTVTLKLGIDSVALRMIKTQAKRLETRSRMQSLAVRQFGRDEIAREARGTVGELVDRLMLLPHDPRRRADQSAEDNCIFYDDKKIIPAQLDGMSPALIERVEIYRRGTMIRVYSKRYVMSLMGQEQLRRVQYIVLRGGTLCM